MERSGSEREEVGGSAEETGASHGKERLGRLGMGCSEAGDPGEKGGGGENEQMEEREEEEREEGGSRRGAAGYPGGEAGGGTAEYPGGEAGGGAAGDAAEGAGHGVSLGEATRVFARIGLLSFGGPAGQIGVMHRILVEEKRWLSEARFLHALNYCMLLPGPEATQLATYAGWLLHRTLGGLIAGVLFVLPGFVSILALSVMYALWRDAPVIDIVLYGLGPAVLAVVLHALVRIGKRTLRTGAAWMLAGAAFCAIFFFEVPFPLIVLGAGVLGLAAGRWRPSLLGGGGTAGEGRVDVEEESGSLLGDADPAHARPSPGRTVRTAGVWLAVWLVPVGVLALMLGPESVYTLEALFFSKVAVVSFGGAYAVLAYVAQQAVEVYGWLQPGEMLHGLGLAETTPGPLIQVVQFVGFLGAYGNPGGLGPLAGGVAASVLVTWVTFVPCFLWIFVGAPYVERGRGMRVLSTALGAITAAVVGVILNLAVWFGMHTLFGELGEVRGFGARLLVPAWESVRLGAVVLATGAAVALFRYRAPMIPTLLVCAVLGAAYALAAGAY